MEFGLWPMVETGGWLVAHPLKKKHPCLQKMFGYFHSASKFVTRNPQNQWDLPGEAITRQKHFVVGKMLIDFWTG
ncbi:hypothetical protein [Pleomorphovibrio marinus]|uniref:hypothetical protein n=1 Tax=Pleomorphovibrio marinus TaxID=2164132 RepID=UPI000E0C1CAE|nr:hypothetical protein [Pleomorphovibrio marinus]